MQLRWAEDELLGCAGRRVAKLVETGQLRTKKPYHRPRWQRRGFTKDCSGQKAAKLARPPAKDHAGGGKSHWQPVGRRDVVLQPCHGGKSYRQLSGRGGRAGGDYTQAILAQRNLWYRLHWQRKHLKTILAEESVAKDHSRRDACAEDARGLGRGS